MDGVVEQDVDPSKGGKSRINHVADLFFDADVDLECNRITSEPTDLLGPLRACRLPASREEDMCSLFGQLPLRSAAATVTASRRTIVCPSVYISVAPSLLQNTK